MKMIRNLLLTGAMFGAALPAFADKVVTYTIDPTHSQVRFTWTHAGFSTPGAAFTDVTGTIKGNHDHPEQSSVSVNIPLRSLDTYVPALNKHLLDSGEFFQTDQYPNITFVSTGLSDIDRDKRTFKLAGTLTVNGRSTPVVLDAKANTVGPHPFYDGAEAAGFDATTTVKRSDFGVSKYVPLVSDNLTVVITVEAIESGMYAKKKAEQAKGKN